MRTSLLVIGAVVLVVVVVIAVVWLTRVFRRSESSYTPRGEELVGVEATVVSQIPLDGMGQVRLSLHGQLITLNARARIELGAGERVWISARLSPTAVEVSPVNAPE